MKKNISTTLIVMMVAMASSFAATIILGRMLSASDFGEFTLLKQIILIGSTIAVFGLDYSYIKIFNKDPDSNRATHLISLAVFSTISILFTLALGIIYDIQYQKLLYLGFIILFGSTTLYLAAINRIKRRYFLAQLFVGGWKIVLLLLIGVALFFEIKIGIKIIYQLLLISIFISSSFMINLVFNSKSTAKKDIEIRKYVTYGLIFWLINSTGLISGGIDKLVIPIAFGNDVLGIYAAISFIFTISLTMVGSAIGYVIYPKISAGEEINIREISIIIGAITLTAIIVFRLFGVELVGIAFSGKYDEYLNPTLVYCFTLIGSLQIVHTIMHFIISAQANKKQLLTYWVLSIIFIFVFIMIIYLWKFSVYPVLLYLSVAVILVRTLKILFMVILLRKIKDRDKKLDEYISATV